MRKRSEEFVPHRPNPNTDVRLRDNAVRILHNILARSASPIRSPPGRWVAEPVRDPREIRAAADSLPWADDRGRKRAAAANLPWADDRDRAARHEEIYPERRPAARRDDEQAVLFPLEHRWVYPSRGVPRPRIARSRSPPPVRYQDHFEDQ